MLTRRCRSKTSAYFKPRGFNNKAVMTFQTSDVNSDGGLSCTETYTYMMHR